MKAMRKALPELALSIQYPGGKDGAPSRAQVRRWVRAACPEAAEVTIRFVAADEGRALNAAYRGKDYATNVLSFSYRETGPLQGDLAICLPVVATEANAQNKALEAHHAHLIVHGMLHLQGYDHETGAADAAKMEHREREILAALGYPDPYE
jgi:probable rRNA maturation factor